MSLPPDPPTYNISACINLDTTRADLQPLIYQINDILGQIVSIVQSNPDPTGEGMLSAKFSKILFSKIKPT